MTHTITRRPKKIIATIGLKNIVIVDTVRGLLVMDKGRAQEVREIVNLFESEGGS